MARRDRKTNEELKREREREREKWRDRETKKLRETDNGRTFNFALFLALRQPA
jgi:hypothetical protein